MRFFILLASPFLLFVRKWGTLLQNNIWLILLIFSLLSINAKLRAQQTFNYCGFDKLLERQLIKNPKYLEEQALLFQKLAQKRQDRYKPLDSLPRSASKNALDDFEPVLYIPVVVHIIHQNGKENIADSDVYSMMELLNNHYRKLPLAQSNQNPDYTLGADLRIEFYLAQKDPQGNCTNGITRTVSDLTKHTDSPDGNSRLKNLIRWDTRYYLNIWVVKSMEPIGYAQFPSHDPKERETDGIVLIYTAIGQNAPWSNAPVHEIGHYFNLLHTFQDGCNGTTPSSCAIAGDQICDTPPTTGARFNCWGGNSCTEIPVDHEDNYYNIMDYGANECMAIFTEGQSLRTRDAIYEFRSDLIHERNKIRTGYYDVLRVAPTDARICFDTNQVAIPITLVATGGYNYQWQPATGLNTTTGAEVIASPTQTTTYTVTAQIKGCVNDFQQKIITVRVADPIKVDAVPNSEKKEIEIKISGNSGTTLEEYSFRISPRNIFESNLYQRSPVFENLKSGVYTVFVRDAVGCEISKRVYLAPNSRDAEFNNQAFTVYPNPVKQILWMEFNTPIDATCELFNALGQKITQLQTHEGQALSYDVSHLVEGVYYLKVKQKDNFKVVSIIIQ